MKEMLSGKVALITGAGRGIGQAIALGFAQAGAAVFCSARTRRELDATVAQITDRQGRAMAIESDVTDYASIRSVCERAVSAYGGIDVVVANAGVSLADQSVEESDPVNWKRTIDVNLIGGYHTAKAAIPYLKKRGGGKIIFIGSRGGHRSAPTRAAYASSKAGLWMLTRVLAQELAAHNICVNELIPGPVLTSFVAGREASLRAAGGEVEWWKPPEAVIPLAVFLASQPDGGPTGQSFSLGRREL